jgi:hypothetical protein
MSLARGLTTINTKKPKAKKLTQKDIDRLQLEWRQYNKRMRQSNCHSAQFATLDEYIDYTRGKYVPKTIDSKFTEYSSKPSATYRETPKYPSLGNGIGVATKKQPHVYTGDLICGIATMHKSNAVPVMRGTNEAKDIAQMRRN